MYKIGNCDGAINLFTANTLRDKDTHALRDNYVQRVKSKGSESYLSLAVTLLQTMRVSAGKLISFLGFDPPFTF